MTPSRWLQALRRGGPLLLDGPMGTAVEDAGYRIDHHPLWGSRIFLEPGGAHLNDRIHQNYVDAGADVLIANSHNLSFGSCRSFIEQVYGSGPGRQTRALDLCDTLNRAAAASVHRVARTATVRAACLMSPDRPYAEVPSLSPLQVARELRVQAGILDALDLDLLVFEMVSTEPDLEGALTVAADLRTPFAVGLTCGVSGQTRGGVPVEQAADRAHRAGSSGLFIQCTSVEGVSVALKRLGWAGFSGVLGAYANDGRRWVPGRGWEGVRISALSYAEHGARWLDLGAVAVGGCCGTGPDHVRALARHLASQA